MSEIHILHVINQFSPWGGAEVSLGAIISGMSEGTRHTVVVLRPDEPSGSSRDASFTLIAPPAPLRSRFAMLRHVLAALRSERPDLVHTTLFDADIVGRVAGLVAGVPVVTSLVNTAYGPAADAAESTPRFKRRGVLLVDRMLARRATTAFHAISEAAADHAVHHLKLPREAIRVIPRGRDPRVLGEPSDERRQTVREALGWGTRPVVINVARQEPQKGHVLLVDAMRHVLVDRPDALLVLAGREGRATGALRARIVELGIGDSVRELGIRSDVADLLAAADVFAFSSLYEGLGGAVVEALGLGIPIVTHDLPAVREVVGDDHPWLVPVGDTTAMAQGILDVLGNTTAAAEAGRAQRARFAERFELERCVDDMERFYRDVKDAVARRPRRPWPGSMPKVALARAGTFDDDVSSRRGRHGRVASRW